MVRKFIQESSWLKIMILPYFSPTVTHNYARRVGRNDFSDQFKKITSRYKRTGYNMNVMQQTACLVVNPIAIDNFAALFNCTPAGRASALMMVLA